MAGAWKAVVVAVLAVAVGVFAWRLSIRDDDGSSDVTARLTSVSTDRSSETYAYPRWWSDGASLVRFGAANDGLTLSPQQAGGSVVPPDPRRLLARGKGIKPEAVAAVPGRSASDWVAVGLREAGEGAEAQPILAWSASGDVTPGGSEVEPVTLPVDVAPTTSSENIITVDAAATTLGDQNVAIVQVSQSGRNQLVRCDLDAAAACRWSQVKAPQADASVQLAATATGIVAVSSVDKDKPTVWFADDESLTWQKVGSAPPGMLSEGLVDGIESATLVWGRGDQVTLQVLTPRADSAKLRTAVPRSTVPGDPNGEYTATRIGGSWYLGAGVAGDPDMALAFRPSAPGLWRYANQEWRRVTDPLLTQQVDQRFVALVADDRDRLAGVTTSPVLRITQFWRFTRGRD